MNLARILLTKAHDYIRKGTGAERHVYFYRMCLFSFRMFVYIYFNKFFAASESIRCRCYPKIDEAKFSSTEFYLKIIYNFETL